MSLLLQLQFIITVTLTFHLPVLLLLLSSPLSMLSISSLSLLQIQVACCRWSIAQGLSLSGWVTLPKTLMPSSRKPEPPTRCSALMRLRDSLAHAPLTWASSHADMQLWTLVRRIFNQQFASTRKAFMLQSHWQLHRQLCSYGFGKEPFQPPICIDFGFFHVSCTRATPKTCVQLWMLGPS